MLITTCTHCLARFRVTPQQLNAKQGQVRCGRCRKVFSGFEALERFPDDDTGARLLAAREEEHAPEPEVIAGVETLADESLPSESAPEDFEPPLEVPNAAPLPTAPVPTQPPVEPPGPPSTPHGATATPRRGTPRDASPRRREPEAVAVPAAAPQEVTLEPPPRKPPARAWAFGAVLMAIVLAAELAFAFRGPVAQRYPVLRPTLEAACARLGCTVPYAREHGLLKLEESELLEVPGRPQEIALGARIRNLAGFAQEYPHIELTLTDLSGQPAVRRVLRPADYMGRTLRPGEVLQAGTELSIQLRLETPRLKATGYQLLLFYP